MLDPGDEIVCGWPSFPSYAIDARKMGAYRGSYRFGTTATTSTRWSAAIGERTKIVYLCLPNNPTGTSNTREEVDRYFAEVPGHVLTVIDQAYFEYVVDPDYPDAIDAYLKAGQNAVVLRTFSKIYGLAGLRVGYGVGPAEVIAEIAKVRRAFDLTSTAQEAALASLDDEEEVVRRRHANLDAWASSPACSARTASSRSRAPSATSSTRRWRTGRRSSTRCSTTA